MRVPADYDDLEVFVEADGIRQNEYQQTFTPAEARQPATLTSYVAISLDSSFAIIVQRPKAERWSGDLRSNATIDDLPLQTLFLTGDIRQVTHDLFTDKDEESGKEINRPIIFSREVENGELGEDMTVLGSAGDVEGEVRVDIWRGIMNPPPAIFTAADTVMDTSLELAHFNGSMLVYIPALGAYDGNSPVSQLSGKSPHLVLGNNFREHDEVEPWCRFVFKYATREALIQSGIIPAPPNVPKSLQQLGDRMAIAVVAMTNPLSERVVHPSDRSSDAIVPVQLAEPVDEAQAAQLTPSTTRVSDMVDSAIQSLVDTIVEAQIVTEVDSSTTAEQSLLPSPVQVMPQRATDPAPETASHSVPNIEHQQAESPAQNPVSWPIPGPHPTPVPPVRPSQTANSSQEPPEANIVFTATTIIPTIVITPPNEPSEAHEHLPTEESVLIDSLLDALGPPQAEPDFAELAFLFDGVTDHAQLEADRSLQLDIDIEQLGSLLEPVAATPDGEVSVETLLDIGMEKEKMEFQRKNPPPSRPKTVKKEDIVEAGTSGHAAVVDEPRIIAGIEKPSVSVSKRPGHETSTIGEPPAKIRRTDPSWSKPTIPAGDVIPSKRRLDDEQPPSERKRIKKERQYDGRPGHPLPTQWRRGFFDEAGMPGPVPERAGPTDDRSQSFSINGRGYFPESSTSADRYFRSTTGQAGPSRARTGKIIGPGSSRQQAIDLTREGDRRRARRAQMQRDRRRGQRRVIIKSDGVIDLTLDSD